MRARHAFLLLFFIPKAFCSFLQVDLVEPSYKDGILQTHKGGTLTSQEMVVQALNIVYDSKQSTLAADNQLLVLWKKKAFTGQKLFYDFTTKTGLIVSGRVTSGPWHLSGSSITLAPDGTYQICDAVVTTCQDCNPDFSIHCKSVCVTPDQYAEAQKVSFRFFSLPLFWLPCYKTSFQSNEHIPIQMKLSTGGSTGTRATFRYKVYDANNWQTYLRLDLILQRGLGGGIDTDWQAKDGNSVLQTRNFLAHDYSIDDPTLRIRYRFQGLYEQQIPQSNLSIKGTYDKSSDYEAATDYSSHSFDLPTSQRTYLCFHREGNWALFDATTRVRINAFQTVNQELPSLHWTFRPYSLERSGIMTQNRITCQYLYYSFGNDIPATSDYNSFRFHTEHAFYRPFHTSSLSICPKTGLYSIFYSNSFQNRSRGNVLGFAGLSSQCRFYRLFEETKHVVTPYCNYLFVTSPGKSLEEHYIFSIKDGFSLISQLQFGVKNHLYRKTEEGIDPFFDLELSADAFFGPSALKTTLPRAYLTLNWLPTPFQAYSMESAWSFISQRLDHCNIRGSWTINQDAALSLEFRTRGKTSWRKCDFDNFVLDLLQSQETLLASPLSDKRSTFLAQLFYRFSRTWAVGAKMRYGFGRTSEPNYLEGKCDFLAHLSCGWSLRFTYEHLMGYQRLGDNRFSVSVHLGGQAHPRITPPPIW